MKKTTGLCTLSLVSALMLVLLSCGDAETQTETKETEAKETQSAETEAVSDETDLRKAVSDGVPEMDFGGYTFRMYTRNRDDFVNDLSLDLEGESGDIVETSLYQRNRTVEERFNIKLEAMYLDDPTSSARSLITAGDDSCALVLDNAPATGGVISSGCYLAWDDLPYNDLSKPWYIPNVVDAMSVKKHTYMMAGEFNLSLLRFTYCMYYNKELAAQYDINDLYERVVDHKWTYESLYTTVADVYNDLNGDGKKDETDLYGLVTDFYGASTNYGFASGVEIMKNDKDGIPQLVYYSEKTVDVFNKVYQLLFDNPGALSGAWGIEGTPWKEGRALFINAFFQSASEFRDNKFDFGILPYPMYDESQESYRTHSNVAFTCCAIPTTTTDIERTSAIIEVLQAESWKQVIPAYYETALKVKYSRDDLASNTLDLILAGRYLDFGIIYDQNQGCYTMMQQLFSKKSSDFSSTYEKREKAVNNHYKKIIDLIAALDD